MKCYISFLCILSLSFAISHAAPAISAAIGSQGSGTADPTELLMRLSDKFSQNIQILRRFCPPLFQIIDNVVQNVTSQLFSVVGRVVLRNGLGGGLSGGEEPMVSVVLPTFPPDDEDRSDEMEVSTMPQPPLTLSESDVRRIDSARTTQSSITSNRAPIELSVNVNEIRVDPDEQALYTSKASINDKINIRMDEDDLEDLTTPRAIMIFKGAEKQDDIIKNKILGPNTEYRLGSMPDGSEMKDGVKDEIDNSSERISSTFQKPEHTTYIIPSFDQPDDNVVQDEEGVNQSSSTPSFDEPDDMNVDQDGEGNQLSSTDNKIPDSNVNDRIELIYGNLGMKNNSNDIIETFTMPDVPQKEEFVFTSPAPQMRAKREAETSENDQEPAASGGNGPEPAEDLSDVAEEGDRDKRYSPFGGDAAHGGGGSGNFLFDIIRQTADGAARAAGTIYRMVAGTENLGIGLSASASSTRIVDPSSQLVAGSGATEESDEKEHGGVGAGGVAEIDVAKGADGYTEGIPGPITRLFVIANRGLANLVQDLILRLAQTSERIVNFKARLITALI